MGSWFQSAYVQFYSCETAMVKVHNDIVIFLDHNLNVKIAQAFACITPVSSGAYSIRINFLIIFFDVNKHLRKPV